MTPRAHGHKVLLRKTSWSWDFVDYGCLSKKENCELWARKGWWIIVYLGLGAEGITFVASKFGVVSFLCVRPWCCFKEIIPRLEVKISSNRSSPCAPIVYACRRTTFIQLTLKRLFKCIDSVTRRSFSLILLQLIYVRFLLLADSAQKNTYRLLLLSIWTQRLHFYNKSAGKFEPTCWEKIKWKWPACIYVA